MTLRAPLLLSLMLTACSAHQPIAKSLCELPRNLAGWEGHEVRWSGYFLDATPHGYSFFAKDCARRGVQIGYLSPEAEKTYDAFRDKHGYFGGTRVTLTGKIIDGKLAVSQFTALQAINAVEYKQEMKRLQF